MPHVQSNIFLCKTSDSKNIYCNVLISHGGFLERIYESELDTKTEYDEFLGTLSTFQNGYF